MNLPDFIAKRTINSKTGQFSGSIFKIAISSIAIGLAIMLVALLILGGFQKTIKDKVYSFAGHMQVTKYTLSNSFDESPISTETSFFQNHRDFSFVEHVQGVAYKAGLLKTEEAVEGVVIKGIGSDYDTANFASNLIKGRFPNVDSENYTTEVIISKEIAQLLRLELLDKVIMYFVQNPPRYRQLEIVGIYETGLEDFDDRIIIGDIKMIQRLNDWNEDQVGGYEVFINDELDEEEAESIVFDKVEADQFVNLTSQKYPQYFEWLELLNQNVRLFLALILFVACFNMVAVIFILTMERTPMIGMLKSMGANNKLIRNIFLMSGLRLTFKGLLYGNVVAIGFAAMQYYFQIIPLDQENYYMSFVPILWDFKMIIGLNLLVLVVVLISLFLPVWFIARMKPIKAIRFD
ncbi:lipoprotein-releasing system permease protein [Marivirga sericea]|uniref:Lipoprotein-releasing system permease protein n=1 Tax=Marivirga sericea TaxID=1028 RepID=A0A1X7K014_9BACT|nr:FtsX-like permease family protein [Marivirga sericea]SMG33817.1 lipoprotein-releasing system permease protein [Marivirga sericea]